MTDNSIPPPLPMLGDLLIKQVRGGGEIPPGWTLFGDYMGLFRMCYRYVTSGDVPGSYKIIGRAFIVEDE